MGNELNLSDGRLFYSVDGSSYHELKSTGELKVNYLDCKDLELKEFYSNLPNSLSLDIMFDLKAFKKGIGISPLSKKRTRKLLMAHGFDRDTAQMYADFIKPRCMAKLRELMEIGENTRV